MPPVWHPLVEARSNGERERHWNDLLPDKCGGETYPDQQLEPGNAVFYAVVATSRIQ